MGGEILNDFEKCKLSEVDNFFILEYVKRKLLFDKKHQDTIEIWKIALSKIAEILTPGGYVYSTSDPILYVIINHFKNKQPITEEEFFNLFGHLPEQYLTKKRIQLTVEKMNEAIVNFEVHENNTTEGEKYYNLIILTQHTDIVDRILAHLDSLKFMKEPIIRDINKNKIRLDGKLDGKLRGKFLYANLPIYEVEFTDHVSIYNAEDSELTAPAPLNVKNNSHTSKLQIFNSYGNEIKINGEILKKKIVYVMDDDYVYLPKGIPLKEITNFYPKNIYIKRFDSILKELLGLYLWDKIQIDKKSIKEARDCFYKEEGFEDLWNKTIRHLNDIYYTTGKNITNVFSTLESSKVLSS